MGIVFVGGLVFFFLFFLQMIFQAQMTFSRNRYNADHVIWAV